MSDTLQLYGTLEGHSGWVTQIATNPKYPDIILSASRDKSLIVWKLNHDENNYGVPQKRLHGHGHFVSDVVLSSDGHFALSGSWDKNLRLWDLSAGRSTRRFEDHSHDVLSVAFSADNRQIVSGSRDKTIKLWNTLAQCKYTIQEEGHTEWVSCVRFSPNNQNPIIVSCGWDKYVKVRFYQHLNELHVNALQISKLFQRGNQFLGSVFDIKLCETQILEYQRF